MFIVYVQDAAPPTNVRSQPSASSEIVGKLDNETLVTAEQALENGWLEVEKPVKGYIKADLTQPSKPQFYRGEVGSVAAWQHLLNGCGYHPANAPRLVINGKLDDETVAVTKKFQQDMNLEPTGEVTSLTWQAAFDHDKLRKWRPVEPSTAEEHVSPPCDTSSESQKYDYCRQIIESHGGTFRDGVNKRNLLSFRQETSTKANNWKGEYDDLTYMVWKDGNGGKHCLKFKSNTEPSSWYEDSPDSRAQGPALGQQAGGDGRKDLGRLQEGYYEYEVGKYTYAPQLNEFGNALKPTEYAKTVIRDIDHDGLFEDHELLLGASDMFFHTGNYERTASAGCQTMPPDVYQTFWTKLTASGNPGTVGYTIVRWKSL